MCICVYKPLSLDMSTGVSDLLQCSLEIYCVCVYLRVFVRLWGLQATVLTLFLYISLLFDQAVLFTEVTFPHLTRQNSPQPLSNKKLSSHSPLHSPQCPIYIYIFVDTVITILLFLMSILIDFGRRKIIGYYEKNILILKQNLSYFFLHYWRK